MVLPNADGPRWKGGGSVYVISYQPEVDCLTAVDGLHVVSLRKPVTFNCRSSIAGTSQAAEKPSLEAESMNRFSVPGLVQWSRLLPSIYGNRSRVALVVRVSVSSSRNHRNETEKCRAALGGYWYQFYFWFSLRGNRGPMSRVET